MSGSNPATQPARLVKIAKSLIKDAEKAGFKVKIIGSVAVRLCCIDQIQDFDELRTPDLLGVFRTS